MVLRFEDRLKAEDERFCITTAIAYMNGAPHLGHAYEFVGADITARYHKLVGRQVYFTTGADEHGQKIASTAEEQKLTPTELCDKNVKLFRGLNKELGVEEDRYIRTTEPGHKEVCHWLWDRVKEGGDIYLSEYEGWYNVREETFVTERDAAATNYLDPVSGKPYEKRKEESFFFRMSKYHDAVYDLIKDTDFVLPAFRRKELLSRLERAPLEDLSVSRTSFTWGIVINQTESPKQHVMYVWFDALANYLSALKYNQPSDPLSSFWPVNVHHIGKDILWFHCVIWPSMLMAAKIPLPKHVFGHGFVQASDGMKMSKSLGNIVDPFQCVKAFGVDTFRYYLFKEAHHGSDVKFSIEAIIDMHNSDLCSTLGNLVHRATALCVKNCEGKVPDAGDLFEQCVSISSLYDSLESGMDKFASEVLLQAGMNICRDANLYLTEKAPWKITNDKVQHALIRNVMESIYIAAHVLWPVIPKASETIFKRFGCPRKTFSRLNGDRPNLVTGATVSTGQVLFERLENCDFF